MAPRIAVSGVECVEALLLAGFARVGRGASNVTLAHGLTTVVVPLVDLLEPEDLSALLRTTAIPYSEFLELLSEALDKPVSSWPKVVVAHDRPH